MKKPLILAAALLLAGLLAGLYVVLSRMASPDASGTGGAGAQAGVAKPSPPVLPGANRAAGSRAGKPGASADSRPVPPPLADLERRIRDLESSGEFAEAAREYPELLEGLAAARGEASRDLIPQACRYLESLRRSGQVEKANERGQRFLERWPDSIRVLYFAAGSRAALSRARRKLEPGTGELFERLLSDGNMTRLRAVDLDPLEALASWGETLLALGRAEDALELANRGLGLQPSGARLALLRGRCLLALSRHAQAVEALESLADAENPPGDATCFLGIALQEAGDPARAWKEFARIIEADSDRVPARYRPGPDWSTPGSELRLRAARALVQLDRYRRALQLVVQPGILGLETDSVLDVAERCARGLDAPAAGALSRRRQEFAGVRALRRQSERAGRSGGLGAEQLYAARAYFLVDQIGPGQIALQLGMKRAPKLLTLWFDQAMLYAGLGRIDRAVSTLQALRDDYPAGGARVMRLARFLLLARLARLQAAQGNEEEARSALAEVSRETGNDSGGAGGELDPNLAYELVQARLELGDVAPAAELLPRTVPIPALADLHRLCAAEISLRQGRIDEAGRLAGAGAGSHQEGRSWAAALEACVEMLRKGGGAAEEREPSDFLDHPRLLRVLLASAGIAEDKREELELWLSAVRERERIRPPLDVPLDSAEAMQRWGQLAALYEEIGARRKERELGWFLVAWLPDNPQVNLWLARALRREEEILPRLAAAIRGLAASGVDEPTRAALLAIADGSRRQLGLPPSGSK